MSWQPYPRGHGHTVVGDVRVLRGVASAELGNRRDLFAYLPPSYARGRRDLPVLYMHDGQNLFDDAASFAGEWRVDETMEALAGEGIEAIVVGVANAGDRRASEYSPWSREGRAGDADAYVSFLADTVRPLVEEGFGVAHERERVGIAGSSLGGLVSVYGLFARTDVFGLAGVFSPAFWWSGRRIFDFVEAAEAVPARVYLDAGGREHHDERIRSAYVAGVQEMAELLRSKGYGDGSLRLVVDEEAPHHESAWAARFPDAIRFLLG